MLVEFSVANFRSIKEKVTLSMVAPEGEKDQYIKTNFGFSLTPVAALFGPNGAGKSNVIDAMDFFERFIASSFKSGEAEGKIHQDPFLFQDSPYEGPTFLETKFIHESKFFQYGFTYTKEKILLEWLYCQKDSNSAPEIWLQRDTSAPSPYLLNVGDKDDQKLWIKTTRENALFLTTSAFLNADHFKEALKGINDSIDKRSEFQFNFFFSHNRRFIYDSLFEGEYLKSFFQETLDTPFKDLMNKLGFIHDSYFFKENQLYAKYNIAGKLHQLPFDEESDGTKASFLFGREVVRALKKGICVIFDEPERHIHSNAFREIIAMFRDKESNCKGAQLIFTTHNTANMDFLGFDAIHFLERSSHSLATTLTPLAAYEGAEEDDQKEVITENYLRGKYAAVPDIGGS